MLDVFKEPIEQMTHKQLLQISEGSVQLTREGRFLGNEVFQAFFRSINKILKGLK